MGNNSTKQSFYEAVNICENVCRVSASHPLPPYAFLREDVVYFIVSDIKDYYRSISAKVWSSCMQWHSS